MKKFFLLFVAQCYFGIFFSQALLPTYFSFDQPVPPQGWTLNLNVNPGATTYSGGSDNTPSCRLDATGEYVQIYFQQQADSVSFYIRSTGINPVVANGTLFLLQQSVNGQVWYTIQQFDVNNLSGNFTFEKYPVADSAKYIRFYYQNKASGSNIALDEVYVKKAPPGPNPEIVLEYNGNAVPHNGTIYLIGTGNYTVKLKNDGLSDTLFLTNMILSGPQSSNFNVQNFPAYVPPSSAVNFTIQFNASVNGSYLANLKFNHNAINPAPFLVNFYGIVGSLASEPADNPSQVTAQNVASYGFDVVFTKPPGFAEKFIVLRRKDAPVGDLPVDGVSYQTGDYIGQSQVAYIGNDTTFRPSYILAGQNYYFKIFAFNGPPGYENYKQTNPAVLQVTTPVNMIGNYYQGISSSSPTFLSDLKAKVNPHVQIFYNQYSDYIIDKFQYRDTSAGAKVITCSYSGYEYVYYPPFTWDVMSREHTFAHSWFPSYPAQNKKEYSDLHNLLPVELNNANVVRSNHPFGEVVTITSQFLQAKYGKDANGNNVYEPKDNIKGDVARAIFYMLTCYNGSQGYTWVLPSFQDQEILKKWHEQDPPDAFEMARNDFVHSVQGNRNPFIDSVHFVCYIDFYTMSYINPSANCLTQSINEYSGNYQAKIFPNPACNQLNIESGSIMENLVVYDIDGKIVKQQKIFDKSYSFSLSVGELSQGLYFLEIHFVDGNKYRLKFQKN